MKTFIKNYKITINIIDKYFSLSLYYIFNIIQILSLYGRGVIEDYIIDHNYSNMSQFEVFLSDESIRFMSLMLSSQIKRTASSIHNFFIDKTDFKLSISKRQCYKIKALLPQKSR